MDGLAEPAQRGVQRQIHRHVHARHPLMDRPVRRLWTVVVETVEQRFVGTLLAELVGLAAAGAVVVEREVLAFDGTIKGLDGAALHHLQADAVDPALQVVQRFLVGVVDVPHPAHKLPVVSRHVLVEEILNISRVPVIPSRELGSIVLCAPVQGDLQHGLTVDLHLLAARGFQVVVADDVAQMVGPALAERRAHRVQATIDVLGHLVLPELGVPKRTHDIALEGIVASLAAPPVKELFLLQQ